MKSRFTIILLAISLAANGVLLHRRLRTQPTPAVAETEKLVLTSAPRSDLNVADRDQQGQGSSPQHGRLIELVSRLRSAGLSPDLVRVWIKAEVDELYLAREQALQPRPREKYWQPEPITPLTAKIARLELRLEKERLMDDLLGYDPSRPENRPYDFLPLSRQPAVKAVAERYVALIDAHRRTTLGMATSSEEAIIAQLEAEQRNALSLWLTEAEQRLLNTRLTVARWVPPKAGEMASLLPENRAPVAERLRESLRAFDVTEKEFLVITEIQSEFDNFRYYGGVDERRFDLKVNPRIREAVGEKRFNQYVKKSSADYARISDLVNRLGLPSSVTTDVTALQDHVMSESARIHGDPSMNVEAKKAALISFAQKERARIVSLVGADGTSAVAAYTNRWLGPLERGNVVWVSENGVMEWPSDWPMPKNR